MFPKFQLSAILFFIKHLKEWKNRRKNFYTWNSLTQQFSAEELESIRKLIYTSPAKTVDTLLNSDSVVALRVIAEIYLNEGIFSPRLAAVIGDERVNKHWSNFMFDWGVDKRDLNYTSDLLRIIWLTKPKSVFKSQHALIGQNIQKLIKDMK